MPVPGSSANEVEASLTARLDRSHLTKSILVAAHTPGHWILCVVKNDTREIMVCDSLGHNHAKSPTSQRATDSIKSWILRERIRAGLDSVDYKIVVPSSLPVQQDGISCGLFVLVNASFLVRQGRFPTEQDFTGKDVSALRLAILHLCMSGRVVAEPTTATELLHLRRSRAHTQACPPTSVIFIPE
jgi:Ulp1 family protease